MNARLFNISVQRLPLYARATSGLQEGAKRTRMTWKSLVCAVLSALACHFHVIRITAGALSRAPLEGQLQGQLNTSRIVRLLGGDDLPEGRLRYVRIWPGEERVIERVQEIGPEFHVLVIENLGLLLQREINVVD